MTKEQAIEILREHNEWRRYNGPIGEGPEMKDPKTLGEAIDVITSLSSLSSGPDDMMGQGVTIEREVCDFGDGFTIKPPTEMELASIGVTLGDEVIVNVRKK